MVHCTALKKKVLQSIWHAFGTIFVRIHCSVDKKKSPESTWTIFWSHPKIRKVRRIAGHVCLFSVGLYNRVLWIFVSFLIFIEVAIQEATRKSWTPMPAPTLGSTIAFYNFPLNLNTTLGTFFSTDATTCSSKSCSRTLGTFFFTDATTCWYKKWCTYCGVVLFFDVRSHPSIG